MEPKDSAAPDPESGHSTQEEGRAAGGAAPDPPPPAPAPDAAKEAAEEDAICRYCFEGAGGEYGELISPCNCSGGQKWVHLSCLRRWQRGVLVSQPTHPDFYDDDSRHKVCNVCKAPYTCRPPTRLELMRSFTGEELAALVEMCCLIGSHRDFSAELRRELEGLPADLREQAISRHWIDGAFLIFRVAEDGGTPVQLQIDDEEGLAMFASLLSSDWCWQVRGRLYRLLFDGPLAEVECADEEAKRQAIRMLQAPCTFRLSPADGGDCGEDSVAAVNLTRPLDLSMTIHYSKRLRFEALLRKAFPDGEKLIPRLEHFIGGPCEAGRVQCTIVVTGRSEYRVFRRPIRALRVAQELCRAPAAGAEQGAGEGATASGERPKRRRLEASGAGSLEGEAATPAMPASASASSSASAPSAENLGEASAGVDQAVRVLMFWGTAGWSRCQLMGEIASGSWGLCKSNAADVIDTAPDQLYEAVHPRLVFAPRSEMSENYGEGPADEERQAVLLRLHRRLRRRHQQQEQLARLAAVAAELRRSAGDLAAAVARGLAAEGAVGAEAAGAAAGPAAAGAGAASGGRLAAAAPAEIEDGTHFDCRAGTYGSAAEALTLILWRAHDCNMNSASDAIKFCEAPLSVRGFNTVQKLQYLQERHMLPLRPHQAYGSLLLAQEAGAEPRLVNAGADGQPLHVHNLARLGPLLPESCLAPAEVEALRAGVPAAVQEPRLLPRLLQRLRGLFRRVRQAAS